MSQAWNEGLTQEKQLTVPHLFERWGIVSCFSWHYFPLICCLFSDYECGYHSSLYQISPGKLLAGILWGCSGVWLRKMTVFVFLVWPLFTQKCPLPLFVRLHSRPQSKHRVYFLCKQCYKWTVENICFENSYLSSETKKVHSLSIGFSSSVV